MALAMIGAITSVRIINLPTMLTDEGFILLVESYSALGAAEYLILNPSSEGIIAVLT